MSMLVKLVLNSEEKYFMQVNPPRPKFWQFFPELFYPLTILKSFIDTYCYIHPIMSLQFVRSDVGRVITMYHIQTL